MEIKKSCIFACTNKSEKECLSRKLFGTNSIYGEKVFSIKKGDLLFLLNIDTDILYGPFIAESDGSKNIEPDAWNGRYPYQVKISENGEIKTLKNAKKIFNQLNIDWHTQIIDPARTEILLKLLENPELALSTIKLPSIVTDDKPKLEATTLWDYPKQSYGKTPKGDNKYPGVTPAFIIYNLIKRYTEPGDLVLDPMAGSGTTLDVCKEEGRRCIAYDIAPTRPDIIQNDARNFPLDDNSIDMIFVDSPYGDNIKYNEHPDNIGNISAETEEFYQELEKVMKECYRVLKPGKVLAWLIGDQWVKKKFTPVGFKVFERLCKHFEPVDIICVARRGQTSNTGIWYNRAIRFNFYLRGFKYLHIMRKPCVEQGKVKTNRKINWTHYERKR
ncbi:DNA methyltransferase [Thermodesulfovibrio yellowstonii]|uniref:DNA methyltransferase n=1 Tax=Thermodesulfovibrio yellowstonii TaxID=28262 RepID=UPI00040871AB|nr:DNA methyltransferase [Thermodesulfovibrio islandicus]